MSDGRKQSQRSSTAESERASIVVTRSGWLSRLGGHVKPRWRKRFFALDTSGRLAYYQSEADIGDAKKKMGVLRLPYVLFITRRRSDLSGGPWPHGVSAERCLNIVTSERTHYLFCDSFEDRERWLVALRAAAGQEHSSDGIIVDGSDEKSELAITTRCSSGVRVRPQRRSFPQMVRSAESMMSLASTGAASSIDYDVAVRYSMTALPTAMQVNFCKWHAILRTTLKQLSDALKLCDDDAFDFDCDFDALYRAAPPALCGRLGEMVFGDYIGELRHNLKPLTRHALGRQSLLAQLTNRLIVFRFENVSAPMISADGPGHVTIARKGTLYVTVDRWRLGECVHLTGCDFVDSLRVFSPDATDTVTGKVDVSGLRVAVAVDVLLHEHALGAALEDLQKSSTNVGALSFECDWQKLDEAVRRTSNRERGQGIARRSLARLAIAGIAVPLLQRLAKLCRAEKLFAEKIADKLEDGVIELLAVRYACEPHGCMLAWEPEGTLAIITSAERVVAGLSTEELNKVDVRGWLDYDSRIITTEL